MERERQFGRGRGAAVVPRSVRCTVYMCPRVTDCNTQREEYRIPINGRRGCGEGLEPAEPPARGHTAYSVYSQRALRVRSCSAYSDARRGGGFTR